MRVVLVYPWLGEQLGYIENCLPKALAALGVEAHLITSDLQQGWESPHYATLYEPFRGPAVQPTGTRTRDGYTHHRLPRALYGAHVGVRGLTAALRAIKPDVVQTSAPTSAISLEAALARASVGYRLFTGAHQCASTLTADGGVVPAARRAAGNVARFVPGRFISRFTELCYAVTDDAGELAVHRYGVPAAKVVVSPLGVDTELFAPIAGERDAADRERIRGELGVGNDDVLCIYTGRMTAQKNPLLLARAVAALRARGRRYRALFVGGGPQAAAVAEIPGTHVRPYVRYTDLPAFFRAADIAVWPAQESSSQADAIASGVVTVLSDDVRKQELFDAGAVCYAHGQLDDLASVLDSLGDAGTRGRRQAMAQPLRTSLSWRAVAERRLRDFESALAVRGTAHRQRSDR